MGFRVLETWGPPELRGAWALRGPCRLLVSAVGPCRSLATLRPTGAGPRGTQDTALSGPPPGTQVSRHVKSPELRTRKTRGPDRDGPGPRSGSPQFCARPSSTQGRSVAPGTHRATMVTGESPGPLFLSHSLSSLPRFLSLSHSPSPSRVSPTRSLLNYR